MLSKQESQQLHKSIQTEANSLCDFVQNFSLGKIDLLASRAFSLSEEEILARSYRHSRKPYLPEPLFNLNHLSLEKMRSSLNALIDELIDQTLDLKTNAIDAGSSNELSKSFLSLRKRAQQRVFIRQPFEAECSLEFSPTLAKSAELFAPFVPFFPTTRDTADSERKLNEFESFLVKSEKLGVFSCLFLTEMIRRAKLFSTVTTFFDIQKLKAKAKRVPITLLSIGVCFNILLKVLNTKFFHLFIKSLGEILGIQLNAKLAEVDWEEGDWDSVSIKLSQDIDFELLRDGARKVDDALLQKLLLITLHFCFNCAATLNI